MHPLHAALIAAANGRYVPTDGLAEVCLPEAGGQHAVVEFTAHAFVLTDRDASEVIDRGADGLGGASAPDLLLWLAGPGGSIGSHDVVLVSEGTGGGSLAERTDLNDHPRVVRSRAHRRDVRVFGDKTGLVTLGTGLVGRTEISVELASEEVQNRGSGSRLIKEGRALVPLGELIWAQVAPGNAASLRVFLRAGFVPIGSERLLTRPESDT